MSIGILVDTIEKTSQDYLMIDCLNKIAKYTNCCIFANEIKELPIKNNFSIMELNNAFNHSGILLSTNVITTQILCNCLMAKKKYFYINGIEWTSIVDLKNQSLHKIYYNDDIDLISPSQSYDKILTKLFKKPSHTIYLWDYKKIGDLLNE